MTGSIAAVVFLTLIACLVLTVPIGFSLGMHLWATFFTQNS